MADIEIVIKISEDSYKATCSDSMLPPDVKNVVNAIKNGTPLPKGYGRLVDIDNLYAQRVESNNPFFTIPELGEVVPVEAIENYATTILASDKGEEYGCILPEGGRE